MNLTVAALQMVSAPDVGRNLERAQALLAQAASQGAQVAVLPEYFALMGQRDTDKLAVAEPLGSGPMQDRLAQAAGEHGLWVVGGTLPLQVPGDPEHVFNACLVWNPQGQCVGRYDKIHLFAFDNGREQFNEARVIQAGDETTALDLAGWRTGLSVCYDLRFPEHYRRLADAGCDLMCVPSAFTYTTGQAHWELLLRARAVENQCFVIAAAQGGVHETGRRTWGHSMIIGPWGEVLAQRPEGEGVVLAELSRARLNEVRTQLPALRHRR